MASEKLEIPVKLDPVENEEKDRLQQSFPNYEFGIVRGKPGGFFLTPGYAERADDIYNFQVRADDTWVVTFPKCGTTWMQELVWLVANDCDFQKARASLLNHRFPFLEMSLIAPEGRGESSSQEPKKMLGERWTKTDLDMPLDQINSLPSPRFIKSHLPLYLLPPDLLDKAKVVYVARNPKDVIVSYYYHHKLFKPTDIPIDLEKFAEHFIRDETLWSPFFPHVLEAWNKRQYPNLLFIFYEDMKANLAGQIRKVERFLNKDLSGEQVERLVQHLRIDTFQKNESVNKEEYRQAGMMRDGATFVRKGKTGDWKNHYSPELNVRIDEWIKKNLTGTDLKFVEQLENQD